jgi:tetratricopeptide (TPR) repeat protein
MTSRRRCFGFDVGLALIAAFASLPWSLLVAGQAAAAPMASSQAPATASEAERLNARVTALIKDLGSEQYLVRQHAQEELRQLGPLAFDALAAAESDRDIEVASRARYLVQLIRVDWVRDGDSPRVKGILQDYEFADESQRVQKLELLANQPQEIGLEPLCRLVRFEQSPVVSKQGALLVLQQKEKPGPDWRKARLKIIESTLSGSQRPGARWLLTAAKFERDPEAGLIEWKRLVEEELAATSGSPTPLELEVAQGLQQRHAEMLYRQSRPEDAKQVVRAIIQRAEDDAESLERLVDWLVKQNALDMLDEVARRFAHRVNSNADLLYAMAQARRSQGKTKEADEMAALASKLLGDEPREHLSAASKLQKRGLHDWSEHEFRRTVAVSTEESLYTVMARIYLAELLYDVERDYDAAEALRKMFELMSSNGTVMNLVQDIERGKHVPARMHFYYACHYRKKNELARMRKHLDQGIEADPEDADILIAMYDDSVDNAERRKRVMTRINTIAEQFRGQITQTASEEAPYQANPYNQYAWLIANTEGNYDLALQYSHKSLEIMPDTASYLDTLAHCYAAKRDFKNAVHYQSRAAELEPHTMQIQRALTKFKADLEKSKDDAS